MIELSPDQTELLLSHLVKRLDCRQGCECVFCRTFEEGFKAGLDEAQRTFSRELDDLKRKIAA